MTKLDSNFGAPYQVLAWDGKRAGVTNSYGSSAEAQKEADAKKLANPDQDYFVCEGDDGVNAKVAELEGLDASIFADNSADAELATAKEAAGDDAPAKSSARTAKK